MIRGGQRPYLHGFRIDADDQPVVVVLLLLWIESQRPLPSIERVPVISTHERTRKIVKRAVTPQHALELRRLRLLIPAVDQSLAAIQHFDRKLRALAAIVGDAQRKSRRREVIDVAVERPRIEIAPIPL